MGAVAVEKYTVGALAYIDSFNGLVPCKTLSLAEEPERLTGHPLRRMTVKITANRPGFRKGEVTDEFLSDRIVPRDRVRTRGHTRRIVSGWEWVRPVTLEYRAWCNNGDLLHVETLPDNATTDQRQAARDACEKSIREAIERDAQDGHGDTSDDYHVQFCEGDMDMTDHEFATTGDF